MNKTHEWQYCSLGGVIRVKIGSGEDLAHLGELDEKYWTVLSCPVDDMQLDRRTLELLDSDKDGKIKVHEVISASEWLCSVIRDKDSILKSESVLQLDNIDRSSAEGERLYGSAVRILANLGLEKSEISVDDASDSVAIFKNTVLNGDGIIIPATLEDEEGRKAVEACIATVGSVADRSGVQGVNAGLIESFYAACADYAAWYGRSESEAESIFPYGEATADAYAACLSVKDKVEDYFTRCKLLSYDSAAAAAVSVSVSSIDEISSCPLARPEASGVLPFAGINPAWQAAFSKVRKLFPESSEGISEDEWKALLGSFAAFVAWNADKKGTAVESLGLATVREILAADRKQLLLDMVAKDMELEQQANSIDDVKKLMLFYRDFARLINNYVIFTDFYGRENGRPRAVFERGRLFMDQRCCDLCLKVSDMGQHADMAKLSGMFLIYCKCVSKPLAKTMDIVAVMTDGDTAELRPGKNGIFYDCDGNDWDATITKVVDNPISIKQAFWAPYRKFWAFCVGLINKSAEDKDSKMMADMQAKASAAAANPPAAAPAEGKKQAFDIAKFAGIFAAIGMALGYIGSFLTNLARGVAQTPLWQLALAVVVIMLIISGPSCFIAWSKLRRRNLGPVLNANGWAVNSKVLVNIVFGARLTSIAKYPKLKISDPYKQKSNVGFWILAVLILIIIVLLALQFSGTVDFLGMLK